MQHEVSTWQAHLEGRCSGLEVALCTPHMLYVGYAASLKPVVEGHLGPEGSEDPVMGEHVTL